MGIGGEPGWHVAALSDTGGEGAPAVGVGEGHEGEGAGAALVMAGGAVVVEDGGNVVVIGGGGCGGLGLLLPCVRSEEGCGDEDERGFHGALTMVQPTDGPPGGLGRRPARVASMASARSWRVGLGRSLPMARERSSTRPV